MTNTPQDNLWGLVLAGGDGTRLQALTRIIAGAPIPKQYCRILGSESLLEATLARVGSFIPPERTIVIVNRDHLDIARGQLTRVPCENVIVQPCNRDTGPGIAGALLELARRDPDAALAVFPSDHFIANTAAFAARVARMTSVLALEPEKIVLLGIRPEHADSGFGYLVPRGESTGFAGHDAFPIEGFEEKPSRARAEAIIRRGALWSSFVMAFRLRRLLSLLRRNLPREVAELEQLPPDRLSRSAAYEKLTAWNFSHDFLQRNPRELIAVRADDLGWSDWGTPEAIERTVLSLGLDPPWMRTLVESETRPWNP